MKYVVIILSAIALLAVSQFHNIDYRDSVFPEAVRKSDDLIIAGAGDGQVNMSVTNDYACTSSAGENGNVSDTGMSCMTSDHIFTPAEWNALLIKGNGKVDDDP